MTPPESRWHGSPKELSCNEPGWSAPGLRADMGATVLFVLPGVPVEMEAIFTETIAPLIADMVGKACFAREASLSRTYLSPVWHR